MAESHRFLGWASLDPAADNDAYPITSRIIDAGAFLLLASGLFMPIIQLPGQFAFSVSIGVELVESFEVALLLGGAALAGLLAALAGYRRIALISALVYGGVVALFVANYYKTAGGYAEFFHLGWGCVGITLGMLAVLCSNVLARRLGPSPRGTNQQPSQFEANGLHKGTPIDRDSLRKLAKQIPVPAWIVVGLIVSFIVVFKTSLPQSDWNEWLGAFSALAFVGSLLLLLLASCLGIVSEKLGWKAVSETLKGSILWVVGVLIVGFVGSAFSAVLTYERAEPCLSDWAQCTDNYQLFLEYRREIAPQCMHEAIQRSRYGNPVFPSFSFATYTKGKSYLSNGTAILFETDAQFPDASGAMVHSTVICTYNLRAKRVVDIDISPHR